MDGSEPGLLADGVDPAVSGSAVEAVAVTSLKDGSFMAVADGEVEGAGGAGDEWDDGGLVALAEDLQGAVAAFEAEVFDVGAAGFADPEAVESEEDGECCVGTVVPFGGEEEDAELGAVHVSCGRWVDLGSTDVLGGVGGGAAVDVGEPVVPADSGEPAVDGGRGETAFLEPAPARSRCAGGWRRGCRGRRR